MSLALYRKYRPGTFAEVIGQDHVTGPLQQAIRNGKVHHAYLFSGPRGCGKTSSARILARSLNCELGPTPTPCGECRSCTDLAPNGPGSLDVIEIDAATHGLVDDARDLRERAFFAPVSSRFKIYIIDEAHMVTAAAFNALLKLVEEPPPHIKFVFATTEPEKVIGTIRSRTHHYPFRLIPPRELLGHLTAICAAEGAEVDPLALPLIVRAGAGSARDALSVLDQLLAGAGPEGLTYGRAVSLLGYTDAQLLDEVVDAFAARDAAAVFQAVDRVVEAGHDPRRFTADLLERFRDLLILEAVPDAGDNGLLDVPADQLDHMRAQAGLFGRAELARAGDLLNAGLTEMRGATSPRLLLELMCARLLLPAAATDERSVLARLDRIERRLEIAGDAEPARRTAPRPPAAEPPTRSREPQPPAQATAAPDAPPARPQAAPPEPPKWPESPPPGGEPPATAVVTAPPAAAGSPVDDVPGGLDASAVRRVWPEVLESVKARKRTTWALLSQYAQVVAVRGHTLTLAFSTEPIRRQFAGSVNEDVLGEALREVLGVQWRIESLADATAGGRDDAPSSGGPALRRGDEPAGRPYDGFAPGDQPLDDDPGADSSGAGAGLPPEQAAVALLQEGLGAKVIGEIDEA